MEGVLAAFAQFDNADEKMVTLIFASWNQMAAWLGRLDGLMRAA
jgi:hypothetical protein